MGVTSTTLMSADYRIFKADKKVLNPASTGVRIFPSGQQHMSMWTQLAVHSVSPEHLFSIRVSELDMFDYSRREATSCADIFLCAVAKYDVAIKTGDQGDNWTKYDSVSAMISNGFPFVGVLLDIGWKETIATTYAKFSFPWIEPKHGDTFVKIYYTRENQSTFHFRQTVAKDGWLNIPLPNNWKLDKIEMLCADPAGSLSEFSVEGWKAEWNNKEEDVFLQRGRHKVVSISETTSTMCDASNWMSWWSKVCPYYRSFTCSLH
eukprot:GHVS01035229.1.p1 GENE.GHVS01035229.1~~GHVS01035229.1.p1  ORF type:complete len:263 (+),score=22.03 GHVS01035229.1:188-976(+)